MNKKINKKVIFVGGVNGCGKTKLTEELSSCLDCIIGKQKRAMIAVATQRGIAWENIPAHYEDLIEETADKMANDFSNSKSNIMLIDCHYAFKLKRAVKMNLEKKIEETDEPYIQAIDDRVISRLAKDFDVSFVFIEVDPEIAFKRVNAREKNIGDVNATQEYLTQYQEAERQFFDQIIDKKKIKSKSCVINNSNKLEDAIKNLKTFIEK